MLSGKGNDRCGSTECRGYGTGVEVIRIHDAQRGHLLDVAMAVDAAGKDEHAGGINFFSGVGERWCERSNLAVGYSYVAVGLIGCSSDESVADNEVERHIVPLRERVRTRHNSDPHPALRADLSRRERCTIWKVS